MFKWLVVIWSLINGIAGLAFLYTSIFPTEYMQSLDTESMLIGSTGLHLFLRGLFGTFILATAIGLTYDRKWCIFTGMIGYGFQIVRFLNFFFVIGASLDTHTLMVRAVIAGIIIVYLLSNRDQLE